MHNMNHWVHFLFTITMFVWLISHQQQYFSLRTNQPPVSSTFLSEQISTSHLPPAKRTDCILTGGTVTMAATRGVESLLLAENCKQLLFPVDCKRDSNQVLCWGICNGGTPPGGPYAKPGIDCVAAGCQCTYCM
jgi:hypothetical protein